MGILSIERLNSIPEQKKIIDKMKWGRWGTDRRWLENVYVFFTKYIM